MLVNKRNDTRVWCSIFFLQEHCHVERRDHSFAVAEKAEREDEEYRLCVLRPSMYLAQF